MKPKISGIFSGLLLFVSDWLIAVYVKVQSDFLDFCVNAWVLMDAMIRHGHKSPMNLCRCAIFRASVTTESMSCVIIFTRWILRRLCLTGLSAGSVAVNRDNVINLNIAVWIFCWFSCCKVRVWGLVRRGLCRLMIGFLIK